MSPLTGLRPIKKNMDRGTDAWALGQTEPWETIDAPAAPRSPPPATRPAPIARREQKPQRTLPQKKAEPPLPDPAQVWVQTEGWAIEGFTSWADASVPLNVLLLRDRLADGPTSEGALRSRQASPPIRPPQACYPWRPEMEACHRRLKCLPDGSDFRSRPFP